MDVIIIGAGLAGTLAAILLGRLGVRVGLIDPHHIYPPDFRAEQLVGEQVEVLSRLKLLDLLVGDLAPVGQATGSRAGQVVGGVTAPHYGIRYETMVNQARRHLPPSVEFIEGRVVDIDVSTARQSVRLSNGTSFDARLLIIATGLGQRLLTRLGITKTTVREKQSLTFGFDVEVAAPERFSDTVFVSYADNPAGNIDYLTMFPMENTLRANLFTYGDRNDAWTQRFMQKPRETLLETMHGLEKSIGQLSVVGAVQLRVNDLTTALDSRREGVVLIGDAFQTPCPAAGTGIGRLLTDIDRLCNHYIPAWLATDGMGSVKISQFYNDPVKCGCDAEALRLAAYRRALTVETSIPWKLHRRRVALQNRLRHLFRHAVNKPSAGATMAPATMAPATMAPATLAYAPTAIRQEKPHKHKVTVAG